MDKTIRQLKKKRKGFSLVELVVVMAIIGILLMVMAPNYKGFITQAKTVGVKSDARTIQTMISLVEVNTAIDETKPVSYITTLTGDSTEMVNLQEFIGGLEGDSVNLKATDISNLKTIVKTGIIPPDTTP